MEKLNVVYVLVSDGVDIISKQLLVSILSLRNKMGNDVRITLLTDDITQKKLCNNTSRILELVDEINIQVLDSKYDKATKSRLLKTIMRNVIKGDFLYIDCDTVVCESLEEIKKYNYSCAILDNHHPVDDHIKEFELCISNAKKMGFSVGYQKKHMNSGVIWCIDNKETRDFFKYWNELWLEGYQQGIYIDQLSFNEVNSRMRGIIHEIDGIWNCQLRYGLPFLSEAKIIHYFASNMSYGRNFGYCLANKEIWLEGDSEDKFIEKINSIIEKPKCAFYPSMIVEVASEDYTVIKSNIGIILRGILRKCPKVFSTIDFISGSIVNVLKK